LQNPKSDSIFELTKSNNNQKQQNKMALALIKKTSAPRNVSAPRDFEWNDLVLRTGTFKGDLKDEFVVSPSILESTGLKDADKGGALLFDDETKVMYLAVVPKDSAEIFKPRENRNKTRNFQHKDALEILVKEGKVDADRVSDYKVAFSLVEKPELVSAIEGATKVFALEPAELVSRLAKGEDDETTETSSTDEEQAAAPVATEPASVASPEEGWDE
jgi:hypothetical protein